MSTTITRIPPPPNCLCGGAPELRRCAANNAVGFQCRWCGRALSNWKKHDLLAAAGVDVRGLPLWDLGHVENFSPPYPQRGQHDFFISTNTRN